MNPVGPSSELVAYLRMQLGALRGVAPAGAGALAQAQRGGARRSPAAGPEGAAASSRPEDLASAIARRVAVIDKADPDRRRKAFRVFLESVLLDEWGGQLINDPGFYQLVESVQAQMEGEPRLRALMAEAADRLLSA